MSQVKQVFVRISADTTDLKRNLNSATNDVKNSTSKMTGYFKGLSSAIGLVAVTQLARKITAAAATFESLNARLEAVTGGTKQASEAMDFLRKMAAEQNVELDALADSYLRLLPAVQTSKISMNDMRELLRLMNDNFQALQLSTSEQRLAFFGLSQVLTSGTVTMEDMRQVTDRLPGAFDATAQAMGLTTAELRKLISTGTVTSDQIIGPLIDALKKNEGAAAKMADTYNALTTQTKNLFLEFANSTASIGVAKTAFELLNWTIENLIVGFSAISTGILRIRKEFNEFMGDTKEAAELSVRLAKQRAELADIIDRQGKNSADYAKAEHGAWEKNVDDINKAQAAQQKLAKVQQENDKQRQERQKQEQQDFAEQQKRTQDWLESNKTAYDEISDQISYQSEQWADDIAGALARGELSFRRFRDIASNILNDVATAIIRASVVSPIVSGLTSAITGGIGSAIGGSFAAPRGAGGVPLPVLKPTPPAFAEGGQPPINRPSIVGENGPEIFMPKMAGTVIPNGQGMGGGVAVTNVFNISPGLEQTVAAAVMNAAPVIEARAKQGVFQALERGGSESRSVGRRQ